ncbi:DNA cytosine methyltransferase [Cellulophaga sp. E6(2014)]|uniref:DNA cytosine methyltransferase n=1 Tax=Cellulophaga sp. E6(2014) TaxID=1495334 RepID=UPI00051CDD35|nr:DNA cytosine methyltransferase [Cellulophaga sp. E6(2014)]KGK30778.1 DNA methyltransferase [Cellulophaga sp. E6(2014)]
MELKEKISIEDINGMSVRIRLVEAENYKKSAFTHYLHNNKNGASKFYKKDAVSYVKDLLANKNPEEKITNKVAEKALQYYLFNFKNNVPFPEPKNPKFKFIDLFAGIGGFRLALQNLGGKCVFTSEWDKYSKLTYEANFGEVPFGDITKDETKSYVPDNFDVLCAGFPCQAFSIAGKKGGFEDTRGTLFFDVAEIIKRKKPKAIFLENVKGLRSHDRGKTLATILNVLRNELGYYVPEPEIINAKNYGVPQNRERIFIVGFRLDLGITNFKYPKPTDKTKVLEDILEEKEVSVKYYLSDTYMNTLRAHRARHESKGNGFGYAIHSNDEIANAVVCGGMGRERNLIIDDKLTNYTPVTKIKGEVNRDGIRKMTPREWARLQGFPDNYKIIVSDAQAYKQFGNSVAVPAIQATAKKIIQYLNNNH